MAVRWEGKVSVKLVMCLLGPVTIKRMFMNEIAHPQHYAVEEASNLVNRRVVNVLIFSYASKIL